MAVGIIHTRQCLDCERTYFIYEDKRPSDRPNPWPKDHPKYARFEEERSVGTLFAHSQPPGKELDLSCPDCGSSQFRALIGVPTGVDLGGEAGATAVYPRYDLGLGCMVNSASHRKWLMKHWPDGRPRETPLRPTDGESPALEQLERAEKAQARRQEAEKEAQARWRYENRENLAKFERYQEDLNKEVQAAGREGRRPDLRKVGR